MYSITHKTKQGGSGVFITNNIQEVKKKAFRLCKQKLEATVYKNGEVCGRVWEDNSQRLGWNYSIEID